jgi:hypothetical protein
MIIRILVITALLGTSASAATISSVPGGGDWSDTLTWVGYAIPGENDDVIINGTVSVTGSAVCRNLTISQGAIFQNGGNLGWVVPSVKGNLVNNGTIRNNPAGSTIEVEIYGNITNNGTWTPDRTCIASSQVQTISQAAGTEFHSWITRKNYSGYSDTFALQAASDIVFNLESYGYDGMGYKTTTPNYFWSVLDMAHHNLTLKGGTAFGRAVIQNGATITSLDSSTVYDMSISDPITLAGATTCTNGNVTFNAAATIQGILQNGGSLGWLTPVFNAAIINNGTIRSNPKGNTLHLNLYGDVVNNGTWTPGTAYFGATKVQTISQQAGTEFRGNFKRTSSDGYSDTFALAAGSDLTLNLGTYDGMGYKTTAPNYFWSVFDMARHNLTLKGGTSFGRAEIRNSATLTSLDSSTIYDMSIRDSITLAGTTTCTNGNVTFNAATTIQGNFQNGGSLGWLTPVFNAAIVNNGTIRSNPKGNTLHLNLYGDVVNNGTWTPGTAYFGATKKQTISQKAGTEFGGNFKRTSSDGYSDTFALAAGSDLTLNLGTYDGMGYKTTVPNYFWSLLDMARHNLTLKGATSFGRAVLWNSAALTSLDSATIYDMSIRDSVTLAGTTTFTNGNITLDGFATVADTLQNGGGLGWFTIRAAGGLYNQGVIRNNPKGNALQISAGKNIINAGSWKNDRTTLVDSVNQTITLVSGTPILSNVRFQALWASGPYQWQRADTNWGGNGQELSLDSLTLAASGVYRCKKADSLSRTITVQNGVVAVKQPGKGDAQQQGKPRQFSYRLLQSKNMQLLIATPAACAFHAQLFSLNGRVVAEVSGTLFEGDNTVPWNRALSRGAYLLRLTAGTKIFKKQVVFAGK